SARGVPDVGALEGSIQLESLHSPATRLVALENTHNVSGGAVIPLGVHERVAELCRARGVAVHLDGARLFNAQLASGVPARRFAAQADTVTFCLSKGLGCPVGSVLCGTQTLIARARRVRKMLGGGLRQSGYLAAAGLYALDHHVTRLADDHRRAKVLAEALADLPGVGLDMASVQTNMVYFETDACAEAWARALESRGVLCLALGAHRVRLVTHLDVDDEGVALAVAALRSAAHSVYECL
ncbi:MAG: aminotransferase class I/II-fold pyridoxal phosphate-dependent enzyme, partial [Armatimonadetes bacterium]|nr:aminotransferase class I/II-fold pyridoxal phosphate-dependent enzyme [Armatimonadota bacterium]